MNGHRPVVVVLGTGGTMAEIWDDRLGYASGSGPKELLGIEGLLARIPETADVAEVRGEDLLTVGSHVIGPTEWLTMVQRINQVFGDDSSVDGIVLTHGTATLEETAYFLHLTVKSDRPVVVTGAMRPLTAVSTDADLNLLDAIRVAASKDAVGRGVLTVLNNEIQSAREVSKSANVRLETFRSSEVGLLGYADSDGEVVLYRIPTRMHTAATPFDVSTRQSLPRVDVVYAYAGSDGLLVDGVREHGCDGLVLVGFGGGTYPPLVMEAARRALSDGIPVVLATRATSGRVVMTPEKDTDGFIVCDNLQPQKARILLMLALTVTGERSAIQHMFHEF